MGLLVFPSTCSVSFWTNCFGPQFPYPKNQDNNISAFKPSVWDVNYKRLCMQTTQQHTCVAKSSLLSISSCCYDFHFISPLGTSLGVTSKWMVASFQGAFYSARKISVNNFPDELRTSSVEHSIFLLTLSTHSPFLYQLPTNCIFMPLHGTKALH